MLLAVSVGVSCSSGKTPPTAAFTVSYVSGELLVAGDYIAGTVPLTVQFEDQSIGEVTSWRWNLGDGTVIEGSNEESRNPIHTYYTANTGYIVSLTVRGPGGKDQKVESGTVTIFSCSEAANEEMNQAVTAIRDCLNAAGKTSLDSPVVGWDGSSGKVMAGGRDAADYLKVWKAFKATYDVAQNGTITSGTDVSWGCVFWDPLAMLGKGGWRATSEMAST
jgi:PKD repeat protein